MPNRNPLKRFFVTFPKSTESKQQFADRFHEQFPCQYLEIAQESHEDGTPHLHLVAFLKEKASKTKILKYFKDEYPDDYKRIDIAPVRKPSHALKYIRKEDDDPYTVGQLPHYIGTATPLPYPTYTPIHEEYARSFGYDSVANLLAAMSNQE